LAFASATKERWGGALSHLFAPPLNVDVKRGRSLVFALLGRQPRGDVMDKKTALKKDTHDKLEAQAKAEGKTPDELASKVVLEKTGHKGKSAEKKGETAVEENSGKQPFLNKYGFST